MTTNESTAPLTSTMADDEDFRELLAIFLDELDERATTLRRHFDAGAHDEVARLAHQLKGAAGGYGYPSITEAARAVEDLAKAAGDAGALATSVADLEQLCRRAVAGAPG